MPPAKPAFPNDQLPSTRLPGSAEIESMVVRTAPAILDLLKDGVPRSKRVIAEALVGGHAKDDVLRTLMRLAVTGRVDQIGGKYTLGTTPEPDMG